MQLPERINLHLHELSDADKSIWRFIESHKETACRASIHDLARLCAVSSASVVTSLSQFYDQSWRELMARDYRGASRLVHEAHRVFAYASGYVQTNVMQELKRLFLYDNVFICEIAGREEFYSVYQTAGPDDLFVFISLSGESERVKEFSEKLNLKGVPLLAITQMQHNTLASRSTENLYVVPAAFNLPKSEERLPFKSMLAYFLLLEIFYVHYRLYRSEQENALAEA